MCMQVIPEDPPLVRVRTPTRFNSIPRDYSITTASHDREWRTRSREDFKDSSMFVCVRACQSLGIESMCVCVCA